MTEKTVLVTGGAGFIGSNLVRALARSNHVKVIDDLSTGRMENLEGVDVEMFTGSIGDPGLLGQALEGVEHVFHLAAIASVTRSVEEPELVHDVNLTSSLKLFEMANDLGVDSIVFSSSSAVYGELGSLCTEEKPTKPKSPYGVQKLGCEGYLRSFGEEHGLKSVSLRYFNVYGPGQSPDSDYAAVIPVFLSRIKSGMGLTLFGDGEQTRDFCNVSDVVMANALALRKADHRAEVYNIGSGVTTSLNQLINVLREVTGEDLQVHMEKPRPGDIRASSADISKAKERLGYVPQVDLETGLKQLWEEQ